MNGLRPRSEWEAKVEWEGGIYEMFHYGGREIVDEYDLSEADKAGYKAAFDDHAKHCEFCVTPSTTSEEKRR